MKRYFLYQLKKNLLPLACLTLFCILVYVLPVAVQDFSYWNRNGDAGIYYVELCYSNISVALAIISVVIPISLFSYKMNRRSIDLHYALPVNRNKILAVNFFVGLILMYVSYSVAYWLGFIVVAVKVERLHLIYYLYLYLASIIPAFIPYAVTAFVFTRANTIVDGIISVALAFCLPAVLLATVESLIGSFDWYPSGVSYDYFFAFSPLTVETNCIGRAIVKGEVIKWFESGDYVGSVQQDVSALAGGVLWTILSALATAGLIVGEKNCKAENCGQISESIFCYKLQIPIYTVCAVAACMYGLMTDVIIVSVCAIAFGAFLLSVIYKRRIKLGWRYTLVLLACIVGGLLIGLIANLIYQATVPIIL